MQSPEPVPKRSDVDHFRRVERGSTTSGLVERPVPGITIPDYEPVRRIGAGAYGEVWLARNTFSEYRAVKIVWRREFGDDDRPFQREFAGIRKFEPISRSHPRHPR